MIAPPSKILIAGGKPNGGVAAFAEALRSGFAELGFEVEVAPPVDVLKRVRDLRDPGILKLLSLAAWFASPIARRAIWVAHGIPCVANQGWMKVLAILAAARAGNVSRGVQLVEVSDYGAVHMQELFGIRVDAVIRNPVNPIFLEPPTQDYDRKAITFVGRLHRSKNLDRIIPAIRDVLDGQPDYCGWIIGDGELRSELVALARSHPRIHFLGALGPIDVRERLRQTKVFVSGCPTEAFGIAYVEALSQGCAVAMPASGGGLEIAPELAGTRVQLFRPSIETVDVARAIRAAIRGCSTAALMACISPVKVANAYLAVDSRFTIAGRISKGVQV